MIPIEDIEDDEEKVEIMSPVTLKRDISTNSKKSSLKMSKELNPIKQSVVF